MLILPRKWVKVKLFFARIAFKRRFALPSRIVAVRHNHRLLLKLLALWGIASRKRYSIVFARSPRFELFSFALARRAV